jgi:hypothetical protein
VRRLTLRHLTAGATFRNIVKDYDKELIADENFVFDVHDNWHFIGIHQAGIVF